MKITVCGERSQVGRRQERKGKEDDGEGDPAGDCAGSTRGEEKGIGRNWDLSMGI